MSRETDERGMREKEGEREQEDEQRGWGSRERRREGR